MPCLELFYCLPFKSCNRTADTLVAAKLRRIETLAPRDLLSYAHNVVVLAG